jgi:hypothetical protein
VLLGFPIQSALKLSQVFPAFTTIQVPSSLLPSLHHPREWTSTLLCHSPSGSPSPSRALAQLVQNLHAGTLRTHNCEQGWTQANAPHTCRPQVMAGLHQRPLQPMIPWILFSSSFSFPQAKTPMRKDEWVTENEWSEISRKCANKEMECMHE